MTNLRNMVSKNQCTENLIPQHSLLKISYTAWSNFKKTRQLQSLLGETFYKPVLLDASTGNNCSNKHVHNALEYRELHRNKYFKAGTY